MNKKYRYVINLKITGGEKLNSGITFLKASEFKPNKSGKYTIASMKIMKIKDFDNPEITHDKMTITLKEIEGVIVLNNTNTTNLRFSRVGDVVRITKKEYEFDDKIKIGFVIEPEQLSL